MAENSTNDDPSSESERKANQKKANKLRFWPTKLIQIQIWSFFSLVIGIYGAALLNSRPKPLIIAWACLFSCFVAAILAFRLWLINHRTKHKIPYWFPNLSSCVLTLIAFGGCVFAIVHEQRDTVPGIPQMEIKTQEDLSGPTSGHSITSEMSQLFRERRLSIKNTNQVDLRNLNARIQLPEPALIELPSAIELVPKIPPGVHIKWTPEGSGWHSYASGAGASVTSFGQTTAKSEWLLEIDTLPALSLIELPFITVPDLGNYHMQSNPNSARLLPTFTDTNSGFLADYLLGHLQVADSGQWRTQRIVMAILFDVTNRTIRTLPPENSVTNWKSISERHTGGQ